MLTKKYSKELYHYGVLGQKWGIRRYQNKDGSLTSEGKKRYSETWSKNYKNVDYDKSPDEFFKEKKIDDRPFANIRKALLGKKKALEDVDKEIKSLYSEFDDKATALKYTSIAGVANNLLFSYRKSDMNSIAQDMWFYSYEDGDQGRVNSLSIFTNETGKFDKAVNLMKKHSDAYDEYQKAGNDAVKEILGDYADMPATPTSIKGYTVGKSMVDHMLNSDTKGLYQDYRAYEGTSWKNPTKEEKEAVDQAKKIVSKIDLSKGTWGIVEAVENAGLSDVDFKDMTDADWKKLNAELSKQKTVIY